MLPDAPEIYELLGKQTEVSYRPATQRLEVRDNAKSRVFTAQEERISVGTIATAVLEVIADGPTRMLTLLLPSVNFLGDSEEAHVTAVAMFTVAQSSIGGPQLVNGAIESYEAELLKGTARRRVAGPYEFGCRNWAARSLRVASGGGVVLVSGTCTVPTSGHTVELRRHEPQGVNPADLLLDLVVTEPSGVAADVLTDVPVRYEESSDTGFGTVTILPDGPSITVH
jgi:hypothetical protein